MGNNNALDKNYIYEPIEEKAYESKFWKISQGKSNENQMPISIFRFDIKNEKIETEVKNKIIENALGVI
jgi:hypothetical protein